MTRARFERLVADALETMPQSFRQAVRNVVVIVEDAPAPELLDDVGIDPPDTLFGLYEGVPLPERDWTHANALPDRIPLFQKPIEAASQNDNEIVVAIGETVIHEFGHYFGLSEEEIEEIEESGVLPGPVDQVHLKDHAQEPAFPRDHRQ